MIRRTDYPATEFNHGLLQGSLRRERGQAPRIRQAENLHSAEESAAGHRAMHESIARANNYGAIRGGGMQRGNSGVNRSYGNSMARSNGGFGETAARSFTQARSFNSGGFTRQRSYGNSYSSRGSFSGGGFHGGGGRR